MGKQLAFVNTHPHIDANLFQQFSPRLRVTGLLPGLAISLACWLSLVSAFAAWLSFEVSDFRIEGCYLLL